MRHSATRAGLCLLLVLPVACTELLGLDDLPYGQGDAGPGGGGAGAASGVGAGGGSSSGSGGACAGRVDCDGDGICETNVLNDAENCGACGRECENAANSTGVSCNEGNCELACGGEYYQCKGSCYLKAENCLQMDEKPVALAVDDAHVYVAVDGAISGIVRYDRDLSNRVELIVESAPPSPGTLVVYAGDLFWSSTAGLRRMPAQGGAAVTIQSVSARALDVRGDSLYWSEAPLGDLWRVALDGGRTQQLTNLDGVVDMAVSDADIFYSTDAGIISVLPVEGRLRPIEIHSGAGPFGKMVVGAKTPVFWVQNGGIAKYDAGSVVWVLEDRGLSGAVSLALTATHLYYSANAYEEIGRVDHDGNAFVSIASAQYTPDNVAVGFGAVYWTLPDAVMRASDP